MIFAAVMVASAAFVRVDVVISAGHEGRPASCARYPERPCNLGAAGERKWTPIVADEAARWLRARGFSVARLPADFKGHYRARAAVFIHFDGATRPCTSGASIGFRGRSGARAAAAWRAWYGARFPFRFQPDNFTQGLRDYYAFKAVRARNGALVLELGEITCPSQRAWLAPRLRWEGDTIAEFLQRLIARTPRQTLRTIHAVRTLAGAR